MGLIYPSYGDDDDVGQHPDGDALTGCEAVVAVGGEAVLGAYVQILSYVEFQHCYHTSYSRSVEEKTGPVPGNCLEYEYLNHPA